MQKSTNNQNAMDTNFHKTDTNVYATALHTRTTARRKLYGMASLCVVWMGPCVFKYMWREKRS